MFKAEKKRTIRTKLKKAAALHLSDDYMLGMINVSYQGEEFNYLPPNWRNTSSPMILQGKSILLEIKWI